MHRNLVIQLISSIGQRRRRDRSELNKLLAGFSKRDAAVVARIDRLTRSTFDLFAMAMATVDRKAQFRSLAEPRADASTSGRLTIALLGGWPISRASAAPGRAACG